MKARFTDQQIIQRIREQEAGERTADVCRRYGISQGIGPDGAGLIGKALAGGSAFPAPRADRSNRRNVQGKPSTRS